MGSLHEAGVGVPSDLGNARYGYGAAAEGGAKDSDAARQARVRLAAISRRTRSNPRT